MAKERDAGGPAIPDDVAAALAAVPTADAAFRALPPSHRREYLNWIAEAKKPETRRTRIEKAVRMVLQSAGRS
jgi:uncharacterized protein YdeI (YjbR/CyaY-like superfamily)